MWCNWGEKGITLVLVRLPQFFADQKISFDILLSFSVSLKVQMGIYLAVQWLGLCASTAGGTDSIPGPGIKIPQVPQRGQKIIIIIKFKKLKFR